MKKLSILILTIFGSLFFIPSQLQAEDCAMPMDSVRLVPALQASSLIERLEEIRDMDRSKLTTAEKKQLRNEVKSIKSQLKEISGGVYLSIGAIIVIILLLILLL